LFGLASFTAERRTKEIGLRKVMGANVSDIVRLLVWQFSKPVFIASIIASLISFFLMANWLEDFPYRINTWFIIPICFAASLCATFVAWVTIGGNALKVARSRPIKALRTE
jgi:putative ABC transport system permease protein